MSDLSPSQSGRRDVYTVSRFNAEVRRLLLDHFRPIWVEGEISNLSRPASGHIYFSLKDADAHVRCAMFRGRNRALDFEPEDGMQVLIHARADLYEARGNFQLIVNFMELAGRGDLHRRFERLKNKLAKEGLFDVEHKYPIPEFPQCIGIVTSRDSAALHDVLVTLKRRMPAIEVVVYPTQVQGDRAAASVCRMIEIANARREADVLILARGGGSLEDLWTFNEEPVARAVAASELPIITGIGHEVDFTIADFVADDCAPTPTAAAQRASPDRAALARNTRDLFRRFENLLTGRLGAAEQTLELQYARLLRFHPATRIEHWMQRMDEAAERLYAAVHGFTSGTDQTLAQFDVRLQALNPLATLARGYSITTDERGRLVRSVDTLRPGRKISVRVEDGRIEAVTEKLRREN